MLKIALFLEKENSVPGYGNMAYFVSPIKCAIENMTVHWITGSFECTLCALLHAKAIHAAMFSLKV